MITLTKNLFRRSFAKDFDVLTMADYHHTARLYQIKKQISTQFVKLPAQHYFEKRNGLIH